jgi:hypothetical protein
MSLVPDEYVFAPATVTETSPVIHRRLPGAEVTSDCFDAFVVHLHGPGEAVTRETAYAIARELRGGRDIDLTAPTDWHVRSLEPHLFLSDLGDHPRDRERIGTSIWFSRTYAVPPQYDEKDTGADPITAPGVMPVR